MAIEITKIVRTDVVDGSSSTDFAVRLDTDSNVSYMNVQGLRDLIALCDKALGGAVGKTETATAVMSDWHQTEEEIAEMEQYRSHLVDANELSLAMAGRLIEAIGTHRSRTGAGLKEAKDALLAAVIAAGGTVPKFAP